MAPSKLDPATMVTRPDRRSYPHRSPWTHPRDPACPRSRPRRNLIPRQWSLDRIAGRIRIHHLGLEAIALVGAALVDNRPTPKGRDERAMSASWASEEASPLVSVRVALRFRLHPRDTACRRSWLLRNVIPRQWSLDRIAGHIRIRDLRLETVALVGEPHRHRPSWLDGRATSASWASDEASPLVAVRVALRFRLHPRDTACRRHGPVET